MLFSSSQDEITSWLKRHPPKVVQQRVEIIQIPNKNSSHNTIEEEEEELPEPKYDCFVCIDDFPVSKMYTVSCNDSHRLCFACMKEYVDRKLAEKSVCILFNLTY